MGKDKQEAISRGLLPRRGGGSGDDGVQLWAEADGDVLRELIVWITEKGGAVRFGLTRDGGTYSIGLYLGTDRQTYYFRRDQSINDGIRDLLSDLEDIPVDQIPTDRRARKA